MTPRNLAPLALVLAAGATLSAQSLPTLLAHLPASVTTAEIYPDAARFERKGKELGRKFQSTGSWVGLQDKLGIEPAQVNGALVMADLPVPKATGETLVLFSAKDPKGVFAAQKPVRAGKFLSFTRPASGKGKGSGPRTWFTATKGQVVLVATSEGLLEQALGGDGKASAEWAALSTQLAGHDTCLVVTEQGMQSAFDGMAKGMKEAADAPETPGVAPGSLEMLRTMQQGMEGWISKGRASTGAFVLTLDLTQGGGAELEGVLIFKPGSPLQQMGDALRPMGGHSLGTLPAGPFALAMGMQMPQSMGSFLDWVMNAAASSSTKPIPADVKERMAATTQATLKLTHSVAVSFMAPAKPGAALFSRTLTSLSVVDVEQYRAASLAQAKAQNEWLQAQDKPAAYAVEPDVIPGVPSWSLSMDLAALLGEGLPPAQVQMFTGLLFGGNTLRVSYGANGPQSLLGVLGGPTELRTALEQAKASGPLAQSEPIAATDRGLPAGARFNLYLSPKGIRDTASTLMQSFMGAQAKPMAEVPESAPAGLALTLDGKGLRIKASVPAATMDASAKMVQALSEAMPKGPDQAPKGKPAPKKGTAPRAGKA